MNSSFQLSFAATLAILLLVQPVGQAFEPWLIRHLANVSARETIMLVSGDLVTTVAATLVMLPIIAYDFHNLSLIGPAVNLVVLPVQPLVMATGLLVIGAGWIHPVLGQMAGWLAWPFLAWTSRVVEWAATLPFASLDLSVPAGAVVLYYVMLMGALVWWLERRQSTVSAQPLSAGAPRAALGAPHMLLGAAAFALILVWAAAGAQPDGLLHVSFLDVGQGNATLIHTPSGQVVVIDGGPGATALIDALGRSLPFYEHEVALGVLSRGSDENITGLVSMLEHYHATALVAPATIPRSTASERWRALIAEQAIPVTVATSDMRIDLGDGVQLLILEAGDETTGITLRLSYGHFSIHFDGGSVAANSATPTTVLRAAGHGNTVSQPLLDTLTPSFIVYSLAGTRAAAPSGDMLVQLAEVGAMVYRTDTNGTITFTSDGKRVWLHTER